MMVSCASLNAGSPFHPVHDVRYCHCRVGSGPGANDPVADLQRVRHYCRMDPGEGIFNWRRLSGSLTTSGQPTEEQLQALKDLGVTHVINLGLHTHEKALADERSSLERHGIAYTHIPVDFENPTEADFAEFCRAMDQLRGETLHVHCIANYQASAFLYRYRCNSEGVPEGEARNDLDAIWKPTGVWAKLIAIR